MTSSEHNQLKDKQNALYLIKKQETLSREQFLSVVEKYFGKLSSQEELQYLEPFRKYLYMNTLFMSTKGQSILHQIMKSMHPNMRYQTRIVKMIKDFAKVYLQQMLQKTKQIMDKRNQEQISQQIIKKANWQVSLTLWNRKSI